MDELQFWAMAYLAALQSGDRQPTHAADKAVEALKAKQVIALADTALKLVSQDNVVRLLPGTPS